MKLSDVKCNNKVGTPFVDKNSMGDGFTDVVVQVYRDATARNYWVTEDERQYKIVDDTGKIEQDWKYFE